LKSYSVHYIKQKELPHAGLSKEDITYKLSQAFKWQADHNLRNNCFSSSWTK